MFAGDLEDLSSRASPGGSGYVNDPLFLTVKIRCMAQKKIFEINKRKSGIFEKRPPPLQNPGDTHDHAYYLNENDFHMTAWHNQTHMS
jgi:hypothetical protein